MRNVYVMLEGHWIDFSYSFTTLLTSFDEHSHRPHGIIPAFPICVGGNVINIVVEIVDANLDYYLLLGRNWIYEMDAIVSSLFCILCFPHEGELLKLINWIILQPILGQLQILLFL